MDGRNDKTPVLMYHEVLDVVESTKRTRSMVPLYCLSVEQFRRQLMHLRDHGFDTVTVEDLIGDPSPTSAPRVGITFDDGLIGNYRFVFPLLQEFGFTATIFVVAGRIGCDARYLDWRQVKEMSKAGVLIGSHTMTHHPLEQVPEDVLFHELNESKKIIENEIGLPVKHLSAPHGSISCRTVELAGEVGYSTLCTSVIGTRIRGRNPALIDRIPIVSTDDTRRFARIVAKDRRLIERMSRTKQIKNGLKRVIGIERYRRLYRWFFRIKPTQPDPEERRSATVQQSKASATSRAVTRIRILFIIDVARVSSGGTERHLVELVRGLDKTRFSCTIVAFDLGAEFRQVIEREIDIVHIPLRRMYDLKALRRARELVKVIRERKVDIVQTYHTKADTFGAVVARLAGVQHIVSSRRDTGDKKKRIHVRLSRFTNRLFKRVITVCDAVGEKVGARERIPESKRCTIYNGVNSGELYAEKADLSRVARIKRQLNIPEGAFVVGMVANFRSEKNFDVFLEAIRLASHRVEGLRAVAIGDGPTIGACRSFCQRSGLRDVVAFPGRVTEIREYLFIMDVACLTPGSNEGFSNSILEKMSMGKPVIATSVGGNAEAVEHGRTGLVIPPFDPQRLAEAIVFLSDDEKTRREMGARGRARVTELFTLENMIGRHERLYGELMGRQGTDDPR